MQRLLIIAAILLPTTVHASVPVPSSYYPRCAINVAAWELGNHGYRFTLGSPGLGHLGDAYPWGVVVLDQQDADTKVHVTFHETAHVMLGHVREHSRLPRAQREVEAEMAAGIALEQLGLSPGRYTPASSILTYAGKVPTVRTEEVVLVGNSIASRVRTYCEVE